MIYYILLSIATFLYSICSAFQDLKERMIYCVPCYALTILWGVYLWNKGIWSVSFLATFWLVNLMIYLFMNHFKIWGGGDSDFLLLLANVYLTSMGNANAYVIAFIECICLCVALLLSIAIGWIEGKVKRKKIKLKSKVAVVPGIAIMMGTLIIKDFIGRCNV